MGRTMRVAMLMVATALVVVSAGCAEQPAPKPEPKVAPPAVKTPGVLAAGVDLSVPPFAGTDQGQQAGIDVDVAAALAEKLGLTVKYVDVKPSDAATALANGTADVVFSVPFTGSGAQLELAGTYLTNAPAFFVATDSTASVEPSLTLTNVTAEKIGAQSESQAYWLLRHELEPEMVESYATLREAIEALDGGSIALIAGDALVAAYIARDFPNVHFAGQAASAAPLAVAVAPDNATLSEAVSESLDRLAADGVLGFIRDKWVPGLPELQVTESAEATPTQ